MELLLAHIIESKERYNILNNAIKPDPDSDDHAVDIGRELIKVSLDNCWGKLDEYYKILDLLSAYVAVIVLHPIYK